jgi:serine/threonine-protein kinase RsbW
MRRMKKVAQALEEDRSKRMPGAEYEVDIIINSNYKFIDIGHDVVKYVCNLIGFDEDTTHWIILAVREGISNAIKHGNKLDESKKVKILLVYENKELHVSIEDQGEGFNPESVDNPLLPDNLLKSTGRGIFYIKNFMDEVKYEFRDGKTILKMKKALQQK